MQEANESQTGSPATTNSGRRRFTRVPRACNECRSRKVRCSGRQPCGPCEDFERHCTFTSTRGQRLAGAGRTKILEDRLRRARSLITKLRTQHPPAQIHAEVSSIFDSPPELPNLPPDVVAPTDISSEDHLENMVDGIGQLTSTKNSTEYYGGGSGFVFLQQTQLLFSQDSSLPLDAMSQLFDSPIPDEQALAADIPLSKLLPSRQSATELLHIVFSQTYHLLQFLHKPTFQKQTDRIYDLDPIDFEDSDHDFLPLFYSVTALGYLYHRKMHQRYGCKSVVTQAMRHFIAARRTVDLDRCRDIPTLQTLLCLILFLLSTARLATAHTFIGIAVAAAMKMGLHSQASSDGLSDVERDARQRAFWTIVKLDIYSGTVLGLPGMINFDYVDQPKPSGYYRDYADEFGSPTTRRMFAASAQYREILMILSKVVQELYPKTHGNAHGAGGSKRIYVSNATILQIENDFKVWRDGLSDALGLADKDESLSSIVYELEMVHNFGHILLYRPFLHYLAKTKTEHPPHERLLRCAIISVKISRCTITRSDEMLQQGLLAPSAWQSLYTIFLSLVTMIFFLATQHGNTEYESIQRDTETGIRILASTACQDIGSSRCLNVLRVLTKRLSHVIDVNISQISAGAQSLCQKPCPRSDMYGNTAQALAPFGDSSIRTSGQQETNISSIEIPTSTLTNNQPLAIRAPSGPQQVTNLHGSSSNAAFCPPSTSAPYSAHMATWEPSMGGAMPAASAHNPCLANLPILCPTFPPAPPEPDDSFAFYSEMEVPYAEEFAWPFELMEDMEKSGCYNGSDSSATRPGRYGAASQDTASFMRINPRDEHFP